MSTDALEEFLGEAEHFDLVDGSTVDITEASAALTAMKAEIARLRAEVDAKSSEIVELQTELHRLRPLLWP